MGTVYKAEDIKLKRIVALKFLSPQLLPTDEDKKRFLREAQAGQTPPPEPETSTRIAVFSLPAWMPQKGFPRAQRPSAHYPHMCHPDAPTRAGRLPNRACPVSVRHWPAWEGEAAKRSTLRERSRILSWPPAYRIKKPASKSFETAMRLTDFRRWKNPSSQAPALLPRKAIRARPAFRECHPPVPTSLRLQRRPPHNRS